MLPSCLCSSSGGNIGCHWNTSGPRAGIIHPGQRPGNIIGWLNGLAQNANIHCRYAAHFGTSQKKKSARNSNISREFMQNSTVARSKWELAKIMFLSSKHNSAYKSKITIELFRILYLIAEDTVCERHFHLTYTFCSRKTEFF